jgi:hypothetical protein
MADCYCDDEFSEYGLNLNCDAWGFDGGDCWANATSLPQCASSGNSTNSTEDCMNYSCLDGTFCVDSYIGMGYVGDDFCDTHLYCAAYSMDGGDCDDSFSNSTEGCTKFSCLNENICVDEIYDTWWGDGICDESLNCLANSWDGGASSGQGDCQAGDDDSEDALSCVAISSKITCDGNNVMTEYFAGGTCGGTPQLKLTEFDGYTFNYFAQFGECTKGDDYFNNDAYAGR